MKILAIEQTAPGVAPLFTDDLLQAEAKATWELRQRGILREIYFNERRDAVLILEAADVGEAEGILEQLPLVKAGLIRFQVTELRPYDGWQRLFRD